jgi:predicted nucleic acid-binding protein
MHVIGILSDSKYLPLVESIDDDRINGMISVISITELIKILGKYDREKTRTTIRFLKLSKIEIVPLDSSIAEQAGILRLKYDIPTADALIGATGIISNADHILTNDPHFNVIRKFIKPIDINKLLKLIKKF